MAHHFDAIPMNSATVLLLSSILHCIHSLSLLLWTIIFQFTTTALTYCGSAIRQPVTPSKPRLWAASAAIAIVLTLLGASGHSSLTGATGATYRMYMYREMKMNVALLQITNLLEKCQSIIWHWYTTVLHNLSYRKNSWQMYCCVQLTGYATQ